MNLQEKINYVSTAPNMVEVEGVLNSVTAYYLNLYAKEIICAPSNVNEQSEWIAKAVKFFISNIHADKLAIFQAIPERLHKSAIYQRLLNTQFVFLPELQPK